MALSLENLMAVGRHALDNGDPSTVFGADAGDTLREYVNQAGRHMFTCRAWNWRKRRSVDLDFTASQNYVTLPIDFGELVSVTASSGASGFEFATLDEIDAYRVDAGLGAGCYAGAIAWPGQSTSADAAGVPVIELAPTPAETLADALTIRYREGWVDLTNESAIANIRPNAEALLCEFVRAFCRGSEDGSLSERIDAVERGAIYRALVRADGMTQPNYGPTRGGAAAMQSGQAAGRTSVVPNPT